MTAFLASIPCGPGLTCSSAIGYLTVAMAFVIFTGSIYLLLAAVFGKKMGYLVLAVAFFGWMIIHSGLWLTGYWISQGTTTPTNLGPRGTEPHWQPIGAGVKLTSPQYPMILQYPGGPWHSATPDQAASVESVSSAIQTFLADQANQQLIQTGRVSPSEAQGSGATTTTTTTTTGGTTGGTAGATTTGPIVSTDFTVTDIRFTPSGHTSLAAATAFYNGGGPAVTVLAYHDSGSVPKYSWAFLIVSMIGFAAHVPFLDKAERKRKAILTGGKPPPFLGPA